MQTSPGLLVLCQSVSHIHGLGGSNAHGAELGLAPGCNTPGHHGNMEDNSTACICASAAGGDSAVCSLPCRPHLCFHSIPSGISLLGSRLHDEGQMCVHQDLGMPKAGQKGKREEVLGQDGHKHVRKGRRDRSGRRVPALTASLPPSLLCIQGLPPLICTLWLLAGFPTRVSTPLWPISNIFITFCNAQSRVPNLKSALFPNVFVISTPKPSGCTFPNAELWPVGAARSLAPRSCDPEPCAPSCPAPGAQPWAQARDIWCVKRPGPISCFWPQKGICCFQAAGQVITEDKYLVALPCFTSCSTA